MVTLDLTEDVAFRQDVKDGLQNFGLAQIFLQGIYSDDDAGPIAIDLRRVSIVERTAVPEPATAGVVAAGLGALAGRRRR